MPRLRSLIAIAALVVVAAVVVAGCKPDRYTSIEGAFSSATIYANDVKADKDGNGSLTVTPGTTVTVDLAKTTLKGAIGDWNGDKGNPIGATVSKCIASASWRVIGSDGKEVAGTPGKKTWVGLSRTTGNQCESGAIDRSIRVAIPASVDGAKLEITVLSQLCSDSACEDQPPSGKALRIFRLTGAPGPRPRDVAEYDNKDRWIAGTAKLTLVAATPAPVPAPVVRTTGLYFSFNPEFTAHTTIGRAALDGSGLNTSLVTANADVNAVAVHGDYLYWSTSTSIGRAKLDGSSSQPTFITGLTDVTDIAVTDAYIFWIRSTGSPAYVGRANVDGTAVNQTWFSASSVTLKRLAASGSDVYIASGNINAGFVGAVFERVSASDPSSVTPLAYGTTSSVDGDFATDGTYLYLTGMTYGGGAEAIGRMALSTAATVPPTVLVNAAGDGAHWGIAADTQYLYWVAADYVHNTNAIARANLDGTGVNTTWLPVSTTLNSLAVSPVTARRASRDGGQRSAARGAAGTATMRLTKATVLRMPRLVGYEYRNELLRGHYGLTIPKSGQAAGLNAFVGGTYVQRIDRIGLVPSQSGKTTTASGTGTMLLRGRGGALLCVAVDGNAVASVFTFVGGSGAGARVTGTLTTGALGFAGTQKQAFGLKTVAGRETQTRAIVERGTLVTTTGTRQRLSAACRSLIPFLRTQPAGDGTRPSVTG